MRKMRRLLWLSLMLLIVSLVGYPTMAAKIPIAMRLASSQGTLPQWIQDFAKEFNANNPNIELRVEILAGTNTHFEKMAVETAAGVSPDILYTSWNLATQWYMRNISQPIDRFLNTWSDKSDILPDALKMVSYEGKVLALPYSITSQGDVIDKDLFIDSGVPIPTTWDEVLMAATRTRRINPDGTIQVYGWATRFNSTANFHQLEMFMNMLGTTMVEANAKKAQINNDYGRRALTFFREAMEAGAPNTLATVSNSMFKENRIAMYSAMQSNQIDSLGDREQLNLDYIPCVGPTPDRSGAMVNGGALILSTNSKHPELAWQVMVAFMERQTLKSHVLAHGAALPVRMSLFNDYDLHASQWATSLFSVLRPPLYKVDTYHPYNSEFRAGVGSQIYQAIRGEIPIGEALVQAEAHVNQVLADLMGKD